MHYRERHGIIRLGSGMLLFPDGRKIVSYLVHPARGLVWVFCGRDGWQTGPYSTALRAYHAMVRSA